MLKTKLNKPKPTSQLIFRKGLIDKLENSKEKKITLVSAPAGYGKSTAISQWIDYRSLPYVWYSLDKSDNDINNFFHYTIAGIQSVYNIGAEAIKLMESGSSPSFETIATQIINDLYEIQEHFYIIFDDYHLIENQQINQLISLLLQNLPDNIHLVLITRSDPSFPLSRLRSQQLVNDIRLSHLCFNSQDVYNFFKKSLQINLSIDDAKSLEARTEGWIAGLQLTALSLQGKEDVSEFVKKLSGDNRHIMDYLIEEVLEQQDTELRDFLLCTSILNQFNASLCNYILNINNGQEIIEHFEKNNMFIIPLDNERNWFRYHHLFASLLQHRLIVRKKERIPELHAAASQWFENNDQLVFALEHSLAAGNKQKALNHFANVIDHLWKSSRYQTILQFGGMFSHEELIKNTNLCFNYFWILFQTGFIEQAESLMHMLQEITTDKAELAMVNVCINNLKVFSGDIESALTYSELAIGHIQEDVDYWNILAFMSLGEIHFLRFELAESFQSFNQAAARASEAQLVYFEIVNLSRFSSVLWTLGDFSGAYKAAKNLLDKISSKVAGNDWGNDLICAMLYSKVGNFLININQIEEGLQNSIRGYELSKKTTNTLFIASCTYFLAEAYYLAGEFNKANTLIEELDAITNRQTMKSVCILSDSLKCKLYLLTNKEELLQSLFKKEIEEDKNHKFERTVYSISEARYQISKGKILQATDLLQKVAKELKAEKALGLLAEVELLQSKAFSLIQEEDKAIDYILNAVLKTQSAGLIRFYINEGTEIETLLRKIKQTVSIKSSTQYNKVNIEYLNRLSRAFDKEKNGPAIILEDTLSSRELDTLKLLAENLTNQEIAEAHFISINTVKTHVRNILLKLEAKNRIEAVSIAQEKGLLH